MASENAHQDKNARFSMLGVSGTLGTADTLGTALTVPFSANPLTGAQYTESLGTTTVSGLPLDNTIDTITAKLATDAIMNDTTALTPKFAKISLSATGQVVGTVAAKKIRVLGFYVISAGSVNANFASGTTAITGLSYLAANTGVSSGFFPIGLCETTAGAALNMELSGTTVAVGGQVVYVEV